MTNHQRIVPFRLSVIALAVLISSSPSWALDMTFSPQNVQKEVNQNKWKCKKCKSTVASEGQIELGAGMVSNDAYKFQNLVPSGGDGAVAIVSGQGQWLNESGSKVKLNAENLGLDRFGVAAGYRSAGNGGTNISYRELPRYYSNQGLTPYQGVSEQAQLPSDWQPASKTEDMSSLNQDAHAQTLKLLRKQVVVQSDFRSDNSLRPELKVRVEKQTGHQLSSAYLGGNATNWVTPVDQQTLVVDAGLTKIADNWLLGLAYTGSFYDNQSAAKRWQNPFTVSVPGTEYGQLGYAPNNQSNQLSAKGRYQLQGSQINGRVAYTLQTQDDNFSPYTINNNINTEALPVQSADAKVQIINADINASHRINRQWRMTARMNVLDRDNQTERYQFSTPVVADSYAANSESNQAYSYRREDASLTAYYNGWRSFPIKLGYNYQYFHRSLGDRDHTQDNELWVGIKNKHWQSLTTEVKLLAGRRDGSDFDDLADNQADLLRQYNLADRDLLEARFNAAWQLSDSVSALLKVRYSDEDYRNTDVGLTDRQRYSTDLDWHWQVSKDSSLYSGFGYQHLRYKQTGANSSGNPTWQGKLDDRTYSLMLGGDAKAMWLESLDVGLDYVLSYATNQQDVDLSVNNGTGYPENYNRNHTVNGWAAYQLTEQGKLKFNVIYEHSDDRDYYWSNTIPDSLPNVLTMGDFGQAYSTWYAGVSYNHSF